MNILSRFESAAFNDAMRDAIAARGFYTALLTLLKAQEIFEPDFQAFIDQVNGLPASRGRVATWPVATILLFLADPGRFMFLKPEVTQAAAETLAFDLQYNSAPNWTTYSALIRMGSVYLDLLKEMGARDFIDVQSFIYVVGGGYDWTPLNKKLIYNQSDCMPFLRPLSLLLASVATKLRKYFANQTVSDI